MGLIGRPKSLLLGALGGALGIGGSRGLMWMLTSTPGIKDMLAGIGLSDLTCCRRRSRCSASGWRCSSASAAGFMPGIRAPTARGSRDMLTDGVDVAVPLSYNIRNVRQRWQVTLLAVVGIALVVAVFTVLMSMSEGFRLALRATGRDDNAIIVQRGSASELTSGGAARQSQPDHRGRARGPRLRRPARSRPGTGSS